MIRTQTNKAMNHDDVPIGEAAWDVVEAGGRVVVDRIELLLLEAKEATARIEQQLFLGVLAVVLLSTAWVALNWTAVIALSEYMSRVAAGSIVAMVNAVLAVAMLLWARQGGEAGK